MGILEEIDARATERGERFLRLVPDTADLLTVVLKGHLLIEEQITELVMLAVEDPAPLRGSRIQFETKQRFAQALAGPRGEPHLWPAVTALNDVRNKLGHEAEPKDIDGKLSAFFDAAERHPGKRLTKAQLAITDRSIQALRVQCAMIYAQIMGISEHFRFQAE